MKRLAILILLLFITPALAQTVLVVKKKGAAGDYTWSGVKEAEYRFETGAMTTDSGTTNTLVASGTPPGTDTTNFKQGVASASFLIASSQDYTREDAAVAAGFPGKSSTGYQNFLIMGWVRPNASANMTVLSKYYTGTANRSWELNIAYVTTSNFRVYLSGDGTSTAGDNFVSFTFSTVNGGVNLVNGQWYHVGLWHDSNLDKWGLRVYDVTGTTTYNYSAAKTTGIFLSTATFSIGSRAGTILFTGNIDQTVVYAWADGANPTEQQILDQIDAVRGGTSP
jgi:hypothetical protein